MGRGGGTVDVVVAVADSGEGGVATPAPLRSQGFGGETIVSGVEQVRACA